MTERVPEQNELPLPPHGQALSPHDPADAPLADEHGRQPVVDSEVVFEGAVWNVRRDTITYGESRIVREFVEHTGAVAVVALDDDGRMLLIKQYRHPIGARDWELPAGLLDVPGEDPLVAAKRELAEEADLKAARWERLLSFYTSPGGSDERVIVYLARGLSAAHTQFEREAEESDLELRWVTPAEVRAAVRGGTVENGILVAAVLALSDTL